MAVSASVSSLQALQRIENEVDLLGEPLSVGGAFGYPQSAHPSNLPPSSQMPFLSHDPLPQELFGVVRPISGGGNLIICLMALNTMNSLANLPVWVTIS